MYIFLPWVASLHLEKYLIVYNYFVIIGFGITVLLWKGCKDISDSKNMMIFVSYLSALSAYLLAYI